MSRTDSEEKTNSRSGDRNRASEKSRDKDRKLSWGHFFTRLPLLLLIPLGLLLPQIAKSSPEKVETVYSRSIYPVVSRIVGFVSSLVPTSLAEILIVGVSVLLVVMLLVRVLSLVFGKFRNRRRNRMKFFNYILTLGIIAGLPTGAGPGLGFRIDLEIDHFGHLMSGPRWCSSRAEPDPQRCGPGSEPRSCHRPRSIQARTARRSWRCARHLPCGR